MIGKFRSAMIALNAWTADEKPLVVHAKQNDDCKYIETLLHKGMNPNVSETLGVTPLMHAAGNGNADSVSLLINYGANVNNRDTWGRTAVMYSCNQRCWSIQYILQRTKYYYHESGGRGQVPIDADYVSCIINICSGADFDINAMDNYGETALMQAVGYPELVQTLLSYDPDINAVDKEGQTALSRALKSQSNQTANLLKDAGATR